MEDNTFNILSESSVSLVFCRYFRVNLGTMQRFGHSRFELSNNYNKGLRIQFNLTQWLQSLLQKA